MDWASTDPIYRTTILAIHPKLEAGNRFPVVLIQSTLIGQWPSGFL
jgi:hypothetical protein